LSMLATEDIARRRWLERVSRYLRDTASGGRWVWLTEVEFDMLRGSLRITPESR
jgi:hypothetical protein